MVGMLTRAASSATVPDILPMIAVVIMSVFLQLSEHFLTARLEPLSLRYFFVPTSLVPYEDRLRSGCFCRACARRRYSYKTV